MSRTLSAPVTVAFDYTRSTGPVVGRFLSGLRDGVVVYEAVWENVARLAKELGVAMPG